MELANRLEPLRHLAASSFPKLSFAGAGVG
jgi:hypothetical protein